MVFVVFFYSKYNFHIFLVVQRHTKIFYKKKIKKRVGLYVVHAYIRREYV